MSELTITEADVESFRRKLDAWAVTLSDGEQAILAMVATRAFPEGDTEVEGYGTGSQSTGAGAGKVSFNPFSITRRTDQSSPLLFTMALDQFVGTPVVVHDGAET